MTSNLPIAEDSTEQKIYIFFNYKIEEKDIKKKYLNIF